jgi:peptidylprolyl isomerase
MRRTVIVIACLGLVLAGCGGKKAATSQPAPNCSDPATASGDAGKKPTITIPNCQPPKTLQKVDLIVGTGAEAKAGAPISVNYIGVSWNTKKEFDNSYDNGAPASFELTGVIGGWQQGIPGMKVGGRRLLTIPPELAYKDVGKGPIGPNETLVFVVDLLEA